MIRFHAQNVSIDYYGMLIKCKRRYTCLRNIPVLTLHTPALFQKQENQFSHCCLALNKKILINKKKKQRRLVVRKNPNRFLAGGTEESIKSCPSGKLQLLIQSNGKMRRWPFPQKFIMYLKDRSLQTKFIFISTMVILFYRISKTFL